MDWTSAPITEDAPLEPAHRRFLPPAIPPRISAVFSKIEAFLERERAQLPAWFVVGFGTGTAAWFQLGDPRSWVAVLLLSAGLACAGFGIGGTRSMRALGWFGLTMAIGCALAWARAEVVAAPRLDRPQVATFEARVERVETLAARDSVRLTLAPRGTGLPPRIRVSLPQEDAIAGLGPGAIVAMKARLMPPPPMALPGSHDFSRDFWFRGIGAAGRTIGQIRIVDAAEPSGIDGVRARLDRHIREQLPGSPGTVATAFATGDQNAIGEDDAEAMRRSGLAHLLSVGGLHITAAVGLTMLLTLRILALSERLALRFNLVIAAAAAGALAGIGYTLLTGSQVPMVRSCVAALLVLGGLVIGREAISIRMLAVAALVILAYRPEAIAGASFQLSFAAVGAIIALHSTKWAQRAFHRREESIPWRIGRAVANLFMTGLVVELAVMPLALYHFHRAGLYGVLANIFAIPLTSLVIMPLEALSLLLDSVGLGKPLWYLTGLSIELLLWIAHRVADATRLAMIPSMPVWAFGLMVAGGLWLGLWNSRARLVGLVPVVLGAAGAAMAPTPALLVTGDGQHLALVRDDGVPVLLRSRSGDFVRDLMAEAAAYDGDPLPLEEQYFARCSRDSCIADIVKKDRAWRLLAIRSRERIDWAELTRACADADIVVADRRLPKGCIPRWLKLDRKALEQSGGIAIQLDGKPRVETVAGRIGKHPWAR